MVFRKLGIMFLASLFTFSGCVLDRDYKKSTQPDKPGVSRSYHEPIEKAPGISHAEYHFEGKFLPSKILDPRFHPPELVKFYETDGNRTNILDIIEVGGGINRYFANDDLKVFRVETLSQGKIINGLGGDVDIDSDDPVEKSRSKRIQMEFDRYLEKIKQHKKKAESE